MKHKTCYVCKKKKPISEFYHNKRKKDGYTSECKKCFNKQTKKYYNNNKDKYKQYRRKAYRPEINKARTLKYRYGLTIKQHKEMYISQNGCCAICKNPIPYENINVDHCHITGKVRKLLCDSCNKGLGNFNDSTNYLRWAIKYLNECN